MSTLLLPCCYLAPISHYSALLHAGEALTEVCDHYRRQTLRNRCLIASPQGPLALSNPIVKPSGHAATKAIRNSAHGHRRHQHATFMGVPCAPDIQQITTPSWQVFGHKGGFRPDLSIVDLLFNMGPEGLLLL